MKGNRAVDEVFGRDRGSKSRKIEPQAHVGFQRPWPPAHTAMPECFTKYRCLVDSGACYVCFGQGHKSNDCAWSACYYANSLFNSGDSDMIPDAIAACVDGYMEMRRLGLVSDAHLIWWRNRAVQF